MSSGEKKPLADAVVCAGEFMDRFAGTYDGWVFAGSVRRKVAMVGDIEHVVIPRGSALWDRLDELAPQDGGLFGDTGSCEFERAEYGESKSHRWGPKYRGVMFGGFKHEVFLATPETLGSILLIRTGPPGFSRRFVMDLRQMGLRHQDGKITSSVTGDVVHTPSEEHAFRAAGMVFIPPEHRIDYP